MAHLKRVSVRGANQASVSAGLEGGLGQLRQKQMIGINQILMTSNQKWMATGGMRRAGADPEPFWMQLWPALLLHQGRLPFWPLMQLFLLSMTDELSHHEPKAS